LYRNNGDGTFTDVSEQSGIGRHTGKGMGVTFADFDQDGFTDIFVANDSVRSFLFRNRGDGTFRELAIEAGVAFREDGAAIAGMGADFRDLDNDGLPDLVVSGMINDSFLLFRNLGRRNLFQDYADRLAW
jgi:enediyne biosynthesis protein E4